MKRRYYFLLAILLLLGAFLILGPMRAYAFQVETLPADNLVKNPWFRSAANPSLPGLDGWTDAGGLNQYWSTSQKESNPSPDIVISRFCGNEPVYCGTSARLATTAGKTGGTGKVGVDAYLYQVVAANSENQKLVFSAHWVAHEIDPAEVNIYGSGSLSGPWTKVWTPFHQVFETTTLPPPDEEQSWLWESMTATTPPAEIVLPAGFPFYKVEIHARLTEGTTGFKMTGVYFTVLPAGATSTPTNTATATSEGRVKPTATPTPGGSMASVTPTFSASSTPTQTPTKTPTLLVSVTASVTPNKTLTATLVSSPTPTPTTAFTATHTPTPGRNRTTPSSPRQ